MATSLPSAALPASGSRGLQYHTGLSAKRLPRIFFLGQNKTRPSEVNNVRICSAPVSGARLGVSRNALQARKNPGENLSRGFRGCFFLYIGVENGEPLTVLQFPDGPGVVGARGILSIQRAIDLHLIGRNDDVLFIGEHVEIADLKRFHFP